MSCVISVSWAVAWPMGAAQRAAYVLDGDLLQVDGVAAVIEVSGDRRVGQTQQDLQQRQQRPDLGQDGVSVPGAQHRPGPVQVDFDGLVQHLDGLITNDKFCFVRRLRLSLTWWRLPLRLRASVLQTDVALSGEPDDPDPDVDRLPPAQRAPRRRAAVGSGLPAAGALGVPGRGALPDADRRGGA